MKILALIMFVAAVLPLLFALLVHLVNNAKGIGATVWAWEVNVWCVAITMSLCFFGSKLWA